MTLAVLTNIPTPYRTAFFNELNSVCSSTGIDFHVIYCASTEPGRFWKFQIEENKYQYTFLSGIHPNIMGVYPHYNPSVIKVLKKLNAQYIIVAGSWNTPTMMKAILSKKEIKAKFFFWSEGHFDAQRIKTGLKAKIIKILRKNILNRFDGFVVPNNKSKEYILSYLIKEKPIGFLPNTVDEDFYQNNLPYNKKYYIEKYHLNEKDVLICIIATLSDRKGVLEFLEAYNSLEKEIKDKLQLLYAGTGELQSKMKQYIIDHNLHNVHLLGHLDKDAIKEILFLSDVFALPTKSDPNPLSPIEASFMNKPLLLSQKAGNFDELMTGKNGVEIPEITVESIKNSILAILEKSGSYEQMGKSSYENVKANFSRKPVCVNLLNFLLSS